MKISLKNCPKEVSEHIRYGCLMSIIWTFDGIRNNHDLYRDEDCMKNF